MIHGSCLCGKQQFSLNGQLHSVRYCHCKNCRKFAGTSPATWAMANREELKSEPSNTSVGRFDSGKGIRCFCRSCGSPLWFESKDYPNVVGIPLGAIDIGEVPTPEMHLWVGSRPAWCSMNDNLPKHDQGPD